MDATIAAIATPPGMGAVALIRVSGPEAFQRVSECLPGARVSTRRGAIRGRTRWRSPAMVACW